MTAKKKRKKKGSILTSVGILLLLAALGLTAYNLWDGLRAGQESRAIEEKIAAQMPETIVEAHEPQAMEEIDLTMPVFEIDGYKYVGVIEIPSLKISLPVMDSWDENRLKIAACLYWGNYKTDTWSSAPTTIFSSLPPSGASTWGRTSISSARTAWPTTIRSPTGRPSGPPPWSRWWSIPCREPTARK